MSNRISTRKMDIVQRHLHNSNKIYGNSTNFVGLNIPIKFTVVGGDSEWGSELMIHDGTVIESGDSSKYFDLNTLYIVSASAANKISVIEFSYGKVGSPITSVTLTDATDLFTKTGHNLVNGDKIIVNSVTTTTGLNTYTVYYVIGVSGADFQVSLTLGGAAVVLGGGNGSAIISKITEQDILTTGCISMAATNSDSFPYDIVSQRVACDNRIFVRAKSESGSTISIGFLLGLHTYNT